MRSDVDAVVVGSGPNGLTAAARLAVVGWKVLVVEAAPVVGGGMRTEELAMAGVRHDVCSAVHPMGVLSPAFSALGLTDHGLEWLHHDVPLAHPLDGRPAAVLSRSFADTAAGLGDDASAWRSLHAGIDGDVAGVLGDVLAQRSFPRHPLRSARFGLAAVRSATASARRLHTVEARALLAGLAAHAVAPLDTSLTAGVGLLLGAIGQSAGWPIARGGSRAIADALVSVIEAHGGEVVTGWRVEHLDELPPARAVLCDLAPEHLVAIAGDRLPDRYARRLTRTRRAPAVFKLDWVLDGPVPWSDPVCATAATVHVGGTFEELARAEADASAGRVPDRPFVLVAQPTRVDPSRSDGAHEVLWGYCHVPYGCDVDMTVAIEAQIERFAPGFAERVVARHAMGPASLAQHNANLVGGDITGGRSDLRGLLARPVLAWSPWTTPAEGIYLCSASTPPGAGVHGMAGWSAAGAALRRHR